MEIQRIGYDPYLNRDINKIRYDSDTLPRTQFFNSDDVIVGNPSSNLAIAFIFTWKEDRPPEQVRKFFQRISSYAFLTGYWKTTNGARYVFANILANPNVNTLVALVFDAKDNGHLLVDALVNFWKHGIDKHRQIRGSRAPNPKFEQVPPLALERVRLQADLVVASSMRDLQRVEELIRKLYQEPQNSSAVPRDVALYSVIGKHRLYDDGARFDQPFTMDLSSTATTVAYLEKYSNLPLGQTVHADNLQDALEMIAAFIYEKGDLFKDQRGVSTMESRSFSVTIKDPLAMIPKGFSKDYLKRYTDEFMRGKGARLDEFAYTYHERIFERWGNQVERAVGVLKSHLNTRRCLISLWDPAEDLLTENPPCLDFIWLVVRDKKLEMHAVYRSQHLATITKTGKLMAGEGAFVPNLYALATLQKTIASALRLPRGPVVLTDFSGHLYMTEVA